MDFGTSDESCLVSNVIIIKHVARLSRSAGRSGAATALTKMTVASLLLSPD